jgi:hypothetical protein
LERGLARVAISPDRDECFPELYDAEAQARARRAGIWADSAYRPRTPQADAEGFQLVEGRVGNVGRREGLTIISFDGPRGVSAVIMVEDRSAFRDFDLDDLQTRHIRIRGIVQDTSGGPEITLSNPAQIERLD